MFERSFHSNVTCRGRRDVNVLHIYLPAAAPTELALSVLQRRMQRQAMIHRSAAVTTSTTQKPTAVYDSWSYHIWLIVLSQSLSATETAVSPCSRVSIQLNIRARMVRFNHIGERFRGNAKNNRVPEQQKPKPGEEVLATTHTPARPPAQQQNRVETVHDFLFGGYRSVVSRASTTHQFTPPRP